MSEHVFKSIDDLKDDILECPLIKPSLEEQRRMVAELDKFFSITNELENKYLMKLDFLEELKSDVLKRYLKTN